MSASHDFDKGDAGREERSSRAHAREDCEHWRVGNLLHPASNAIALHSDSYSHHFRPARPPQKRPWPRETKDLSIFAAWKFAEQGKRTLIFVTQANWVEGFGNVARELVERGYLGSLLDDPEAIERAAEVGREWLGDDHCAVKCLQIGVAIHHGGLPNPFLRELELLLSQGAIKVTVASPTLHQP
jgi:hypothetical protein